MKRMALGDRPDDDGAAMLRLVLLGEGLVVAVAAVLVDVAPLDVKVEVEVDPPNVDDTAGMCGA